MKDFVVRVKGVNKKFGNNVILKNINLNVKKGELLCIVGTNGSGKTTLLKSIIGFVEPEDGEIFYNSKNIKSIEKKVKSDFGFATQENAFYPKLTVEENMNYFGNLYGLKKDVLKVNIEKLLKLVDLYTAKDVLAENLSMGMERRLDIACSLIHNPKILILDEPTEDLDVTLRKSILILIKAINKRGTTVVMTSHLLSEIEDVFDRIAILNNKTIAKTGTLKEFRKTTRKKSLNDIFEVLTKHA
ncbi:ABC transporter ATP-binding protein [archaeon]|nr:ABC transporter ATP-binding protein [archaeon]|tara:strand:+ start:3864 stop:4595 length:732 start_codon:yes stop_codon:yes gene_type:complete